MPPTALRSFLDNRRVHSSNNEWNVCGIEQHKGKYKIPASEYLEFLKLVHDTIFVHEPEVSLVFMDLLERHMPNKTHGPILIDLDFRFTDDGVRPLHRRITDRHIKHFIKEYTNAMDLFFDMSGVSPRFFVQRKSEPEVDSRSNKIKDGVHIICPDIIMDYKKQYVLRGYMLGKMESIFGGLDLKNEYCDVFDPSVIERNGWFIYGSGKGYKYPYFVTHIYKKNTNELQLVPPIFYNMHNKWNLLKLFSLHLDKENETVLPLRSTCNEWDLLYTIWSNGRINGHWREYFQQTGCGVNGEKLCIKWRCNNENIVKYINIYDIFEIVNLPYADVIQFMCGLITESRVLDSDTVNTITQNDIIWKFNSLEDKEYIVPIIQAIKAGTGVEADNLAELIDIMNDTSTSEPTPRIDSNIIIQSNEEQHDDEYVGRERSESDDVPDEVIQDEGRQINIGDEDWYLRVGRNSFREITWQTLESLFGNRLISGGIRVVKNIIKDRVCNIADTARDPSIASLLPTIILYAAFPQECITMRQEAIANACLFSHRVLNYYLKDRARDAWYAGRRSNGDIPENDMWSGSSTENLTRAIIRVIFERNADGYWPEYDENSWIQTAVEGCLDGNITTNISQDVNKFLTLVMNNVDLEHLWRYETEVIERAEEAETEMEEEEEVIEPIPVPLANPINKIIKKSEELVLCKRIRDIIVADIISKGEECSITMEPLTAENLAITSCFHFFEKTAIGKWICEHHTCPQCRERATVFA